MAGYSSGGIVFELCGGMSLIIKMGILKGMVKELDGNTLNVPDFFLSKFLEECKIRLSVMRKWWPER